MSWMPSNLLSRSLLRTSSTFNPQFQTGSMMFIMWLAYNPSHITLISLSCIIALSRGAIPESVESICQLPNRELKEDGPFWLGEPPSDQEFSYQSQTRSRPEVYHWPGLGPQDFRAFFDDHIHLEATTEVEMTTRAFAHSLHEQTSEQDLNSWIEMFAERSKKLKGSLDALGLHTTIAYGFCNLA